VEIPLAEPVPAQRLLLVTSLLEEDGIAMGATVAEVVLTTSAGQEIVLPLRKGIEVQSWDQDCLPEGACQAVYEWHKRLALLGQQAYPGAWGDFQARLHGTALVLPQEIYTGINMRYLETQGILYTWAMALETP